LLTGLASTPHLQVGLLLSGQGTVLASTQPLLLDTPAHEAWPELNQPENLARLQRAREQAQGIVEISSDRRYAIGFSPVRLGDPLASPEGGYLFLQYDLTELVGASRQKARRSVLRSTLTLLLLAVDEGKRDSVDVHTVLNLCANIARSQTRRVGWWSRSGTPVWASPRAPAPALRSVLHHQTRGRGNRVGPVHLPRDCHGPGRAHHCRE
jgi:hypothetical protein